MANWMTHPAVLGAIGVAQGASSAMFQNSSRQRQRLEGEVDQQAQDLRKLSMERVRQSEARDQAEITYNRDQWVYKVDSAMKLLSTQPTQGKRMAESLLSDPSLPEEYKTQLQGVVGMAGAQETDRTEGTGDYAPPQSAIDKATAATVAESRKSQESILMGLEEQNTELALADGLKKAAEWNHPEAFKRIKAAQRALKKQEKADDDALSKQEKADVAAAGAQKLELFEDELRKRHGIGMQGWPVADKIAYEAYAREVGATPKKAGIPTDNDWEQREYDLTAGIQTSSPDSAMAATRTALDPTFVPPERPSWDPQDQEGFMGPKAPPERDSAQEYLRRNQPAPEDDALVFSSASPAGGLPRPTPPIPQLDVLGQDGGDQAEVARLRLKLIQKVKSDPRLSPGEQMQITARINMSSLDELRETASN